MYIISTILSTPITWRKCSSTSNERTRADKATLPHCYNLWKCYWNHHAAPLRRCAPGARISSQRCRNETVILNLQNKRISQVCHDNRFLNEFALRRLDGMTLSAAKSALQILEALLLTRKIEMFVRNAWWALKHCSAEVLEELSYSTIYYVKVDCRLAQSLDDINRFISHAPSC